MTEPRVAFVSHIHEERPLAVALKQVLEQAVPDYEVWVSEQDIAVGTQWLQALNTAMARADDVLVLCSSRSSPAPWVNFEGGAGVGAGARVIPVCHSDLTLAALRFPFSALQGHQLATADDLRLLVAALGGRLDPDGVDVAWREVDAGRAAIDHVPPAVRPLTPPSAARGVLVDVSHGQAAWPLHGGPSVFTWASDGVADGPADVEVRSVDAADQLRAADLAAWQGLVVVMPFRARLAAGTIDQVVEWVRSGGRLALLGFELGDLHHGGNLVELASRFALRFDGDIVAPAGWSGATKPYDQAIALDTSSTHPLFEGVGTVRWRNLQTIAREPGTVPLLTVGANPVSMPTPESVRFVGGSLSMPNPAFSLVAVDAGVPVVAAATPFLTGEGAVVAIGTWDLTPSGVDEPGNGRFAANLLRWLSAETT